MNFLIDYSPAFFTMLVIVIVYYPEVFSNSFWVAELHQDNEQF